MTPKYPGTPYEIPREKAHSESEVTPNTEHLLKVVHNAEEQRICDLAQVNERLGKVEAVAVRMVEHLDAEDKRRIAAEASRLKRNRRIKWITVTVGVPMLVAIVGSGAAAWTQILVQSRATASAVATHTVQSAQPSTEDTYRAGFHDGAKSVIDEQLARLPSQIPPIQKQADSVAARGKGR